MDDDLLTQPVQDNWEEVEADLEATAEELRAEGWTALTLHTGDATSRTGIGDRPAGLDVLVPTNEFDELEAELEAGADFTETAIFRQAAGGVMFLVFVLRDPERQVAALFPAYYPQRGESAMQLAEQARESGMVRVYVRPLEVDRTVTFAVENPSLVFPEEYLPDDE